MVFAWTKSLYLLGESLASQVTWNLGGEPDVPWEAGTFGVGSPWDLRISQKMPGILDETLVSCRDCHVNHGILKVCASNDVKCSVDCLWHFPRPQRQLLVEILPNT